VDADGTVLLADFGVSSSLTENGDRRSCRKTFVGTVIPCEKHFSIMPSSTNLFLQALNCYVFFTAMLDGP
jgi:hypothetical protein